MKTKQQRKDEAFNWIVQEKVENILEKALAMKDGENAQKCHFCENRTNEGKFVCFPCYRKRTGEILEMIEELQEKEAKDCNEDEYLERASSIEILEELRQKITAMDGENENKN